MAWPSGQSLLQRSRAGSRDRTNGNSSTEDLLDDAHWESRLARSGRCSALVRLAAGNQDILLGHATWSDYSQMTRIFKYYKFSLRGAGSVTTLMALSSYPGAVSSTDDFYIMDSGLAIMETSLTLLNPTVW